MWEHGIKCANYPIRRSCTDRVTFRKSRDLAHDLEARASFLSMTMLKSLALLLNIVQRLGHADRKVPLARNIRRTFF